MQSANGELADPRTYRLPPEWDQHAGTWLQWPYERDREGYQLKLERTWLIMADVLHQHESVYIIVNDERHYEYVSRSLDCFGIGPKNVELFIIPMNDVWARDNGPIFVVNDEGELAITNWEFNGWRQRFEHELDNQVSTRIGEKIAVPVFDAPMVLEGGSLSVNGSGTLLATRTSIIDSYRNPGISQSEIENTLSQYLGLTHFIWLTGAGRGECEKWGDATDSHIDIVARFTDESTVI